MKYVMLAGLAVVLPMLYIGALLWQRDDFQEEKNRSRKPLRSIPEILVMIASEIALLKIWYEYAEGKMQGVYFALLYMVLVVMTILCVTDLWEKIVPNKILGVMILVGIIIIGVQGVKDMSTVIKMVPSIILGVVFCVISFGLTYVISKGSLGSGDVKLALLLGIFLTGQYVVATIFYGCLASCIYSIVQLLRKRLTRKDVLPFVPFLYIGLIITYLAG